MPFPTFDEKVPKKQSIEERTRANILNQDLVRPFGPIGASAKHTHGLTSKAMGDDPRKDQWGDNALVEDKSNVTATRPKHDRQRGDIVR